MAVDDERCTRHPQVVCLLHGGRAVRRAQQALTEAALHVSSKVDAEAEEWRHVNHVDQRWARARAPSSRTGDTTLGAAHTVARMLALGGEAEQAAEGRERLGRVRASSRPLLEGRQVERWRRITPAAGDGAVDAPNADGTAAEALPVALAATRAIRRARRAPVWARLSIRPPDAAVGARCAADPRHQPPRHKASAQRAAPRHTGATRSDGSPRRAPASPPTLVLASCQREQREGGQCPSKQWRDGGLQRPELIARWSRVVHRRTPRRRALHAANEAGKLGHSHVRAEVCAIKGGVRTHAQRIMSSSE